MKRFLIALLLAATASPALACDLRISTAPAVVQLAGAYDPLAQERRSLSSSMRVLNLGSVCRALVSLTSVAGGVNLQGPGGETIVLEVRNDAGLPVEVSRRQGSVAPASVVASLSFEENEERTINLVFEVAPGQLVLPGRYSGEALIEVESEGSGSRLEQRLVLDLEVASATEIRLSGAIATPPVAAGRAGRLGAPIIRLGNLSSNQMISDIPVVLMIMSTSRYALRFESENAGRLRHESSPVVDAGSFGFIPYELLVDQVRAPLETRGGEITRPRPGGFLRSELLPLAIRVGDTTGQPAGIYSDTVRIEILPRG